VSFRPVKPRAHGSTKATVAALYAQAGGAKRIADLIGRSATVTYSYTDPDEPAQIAFDLVRKIVQFTGATAPAEDLAALAGGVFLPCSDADGQTFDALAAESARGDWGELTAALLQAHADGKLDKIEERDILRRLDKLIHALACARAQLIALEEPRRPQARS